MFSIAICDDEPAICTQVRQILSTHVYAGEFQIQEFHTGEGLWESIQSGMEYSLIILDIELKALNGVVVGKLIREEIKNYLIQILYISGIAEYAMELFDIRPINFLLKPLNAEKLLSCVEEAMGLIRRNQPCFSFTLQKGAFWLPYGEIRYFESIGKKIIVKAVGAEYIFSGKLSEIENQLPQKEFVRIHQSYLIHQLYIRKMQYEQIFLDNGTILPISQPYRKSVREYLFTLIPEKNRG